jgi:hypothetical protein
MPRMGSARLAFNLITLHHLRGLVRAAEIQQRLHTETLKITKFLGKLQRQRLVAQEL